MSSISNIRANRITAQNITSNFFQGTNADITNIKCVNENVDNNLVVGNDLTVLGETFLDGNIDITGNLGITGYVNIYNTIDTGCTGATGALVVSGGVSIQKNLFVKGNECLNGNLGVTGTINNAYLRFGNTSGNYSINNNFTGATGQYNVYFGCSAGTVYQVDDNIFIGYQVGNGSTGNSSIGIGSNALINNYGNYNIAIGENALSSGCTGSDNIAIGFQALETTIGSTGDDPNIAIGTRALYYTSTGRANVAIGHEALYQNNTGENNIAIGFNALRDGGESENIAIGTFSLFNCNGYNNTAIGMDAGCVVSNGVNTGDYFTNYNTFLGSATGFNLNYGNCNVHVGSSAGMTGITGSYNVFIGASAGMTGNTGTTGNVCIGYSAGNYSTKNYNTFVGHQSGWTGTTLYNGGTGNICIGAYSYPLSNTMSNTVVLGDVLNNLYVTTDLINTTAWSWVSDGRDKTDIETIPVGIDLINKIQPSIYKWDKRSWYENGIPDGSKKNNKWNSGFIAQQLEQVQNENDAEYLNLIDKNDERGLRIATTNLLPVIVKALQDLSVENANLKERITELENKVNSL
jgi:hypothetical protein